MAAYFELLPRSTLLPYYVLFNSPDLYFSANNLIRSLTVTNAGPLQTRSGGPRPVARTAPQESNQPLSDIEVRANIARETAAEASTAPISPESLGIVGMRNGRRRPLILKEEVQKFLEGTAE
jgi:hypothetical protein